MKALRPSCAEYIISCRGIVWNVYSEGLSDFVFKDDQPAKHGVTTKFRVPDGKIKACLFQVYPLYVGVCLHVGFVECMQPTSLCTLSKGQPSYPHTWRTCTSAHMHQNIVHAGINYSKERKKQASAHLFFIIVVIFATFLLRCEMPRIVMEESIVGCLVPCIMIYVNRRT